MDDFAGKEDAYRRMMTPFRREDARFAIEVTCRPRDGESISYEASESALGELIGMQDTVEEVKRIFQRIAADAALAANPDSQLRTAARVRGLNEVKLRMMETAARALIGIYGEPGRLEGAYGLGSMMRMAEKVMDQMERKDVLLPRQLTPATMYLWKQALKRIIHNAQSAVNGLETPEQGPVRKRAGTDGTTRFSAARVRI